MRIAVFHNLPSGGAKRTVFEQVSRLAKRHEIDLFSLTCSNHFFLDLEPFVRRVHLAPFVTTKLFPSPFGRLNQGIRIIDLLRLRRVLKALGQQIRQRDYEVALVHPCQFTFSPTLLRYSRIPSLYYRQDVARWIHDPPIPRPYCRKAGWQERLDHLDPLLRAYLQLLAHEDITSMRSATRVVTNSYFVRESLYRIYGIAPSVCYHGVDTVHFRPLGLRRQDFVLSVGRVDPAKGYDFVIESIARIPPSLRPSLVIAHNATIPQEEQYLRNLAVQSCVTLEFHSMISDDELLNLYNRARCVVYAPVMESFGLVPLEAMACGTPVVAIREGGVRETVVHGVTGLLADRDSCEFTSAILTLLQDHALGERLGRQAREIVQTQWNWDCAIGNLESHLQSVAQQKNRRT